MNIDQLIQEALDAFWEVIARNYPQAKTGDLSPLSDLALDQAARTAVEEWVRYNVRPPQPIVIEVRGGVVQDVLNVPPGCDYEIRDYDNLRTDVHAGYRFKLVLPVERFPGLRAPAGMTGTVTEVGGDVCARMNQPVPAAGRRDTHLLWDSVDEFLVDTDPMPEDGPAVAPLPLDPEGMNDKRAAWADQAIQTFRHATGTDAEDVLCDLLADMNHWADRNGFSFEHELSRGFSRYEEETDPD